MATHSSINAWRIPWTQEPGRLSPWGHRGRHDLATNNNKYQRLMNFLSQMKIIKKKQFVKRIKTREFLLALGRRLQDLCFWFFLALSPTTAALEAAQGSLTLWPMTKNIQCQSHWTLLLFSRYVVFDSLWPHGLQHATPGFPVLSPRICSNSCASSQWSHPIISSSVTHFFSCLQFFPASGSFPMNQLFTSSGQSTGPSASASVHPMNIQGWSPLGLTGLILLSKGLSRVLFSTTVKKHQFFSVQSSLWSSYYIRTWLLEKPYLWPYRI